MTSIASAGAALAISAGAPATFDAAGYAALTYTEIGSIEKIGALGAVFAKIEFQPLKGPKQKYKGSRDNGSLAPSLAYDPADAGQILMRTAAASQTGVYSFKVTFADGAKRYFQGPVFGFPETVDGADTVLMVNPTVEITTDIVSVAGP